MHPGDRVLDAGGGTGSTAILAAYAAGESGHVTLIDVSAGMLTKAQQRIRGQRLGDRIECVEGDIYQPPYPDEHFDVVLSTYSLCPLQRPDQAARTLFRLVRPGGYLGIAHSADPRTPWVRGLARGVESLISHWPALYLGCRSVDVRDALIEAGAIICLDALTGVPLWPFKVLVFKKPEKID